MHGEGVCDVDLLAYQRRLVFILLGGSLFLAGVALGGAVGDPHDEPTWARFSGFALAATLAGIASLGLLPQGHRVRPWLWAGSIAAMGYAALALIARFVHLA